MGRNRVNDSPARRTVNVVLPEKESRLVAEFAERMHLPCATAYRQLLCLAIERGIIADLLPAPIVDGVDQ